MSHLVLARKYRPRIFDDVIGQDVIVATLKKAIEKSRVAHALLFTGGRGIGKTTIARIVAKALVCLDREGANPCGACTHCTSIDNFSSLDVMEIDGASHTGVDDIRDLRESARFQPASARLKIFIIDEVHMLSTSAFNALLKILEEPPAHVMFIFATTEVHKIPKTILSRCQRYDFRRMTIEMIAATLKQILVAEQIAIDDEGLRMVARLADGGMRDALSMIEQIISSHHNHYSADMVAQILGVVSHSAIKDISLAIVEQRVCDALLITKEVYDKGLDLCQLMDALAERFRVLSLCAHVEADKAKTLIDSLDDDDIALSKRHDKIDLKRLFAMAIDGMKEVFVAHKPIFALELFILRAALRPPQSDAFTINYCLNKLDAIMHNRPLPKEPWAVQPPPSAPVLLQSPPQPPAFHQAPSVVGKEILTAARASEVFTTVVQKIEATSHQMASHLLHARPVLEADKLTLYFEHDLHYEQAQLQGAQKRVEDELGLIVQAVPVVLELKKNDQLTTIKAVKTVWETDIENKKLEEQALYERARENPLVKKALEIFGGDITNVKKRTDGDLSQKN